MIDKTGAINQKIKILENQILDDAEASLLNMIDLDSLLADPEGHLKVVADEFLAKHLNKIREAGKIGKKLATDLVKGKV